MLVGPACRLRGGLPTKDPFAIGIPVEAPCAPTGKPSYLNGRISSCIGVLDGGHFQLGRCPHGLVNHCLIGLKPFKALDKIFTDDFRIHARCLTAHQE